MDTAININSPVFKCLLNDIDEEIKRCLGHVIGNSFEGAEINVKLIIDIPETEREVPMVDEDGEITCRIYKYRKPNIQHKVTSTLKKQYKRQGCYTENKAVVERDGEYLAVAIEEEEPLLLVGDKNFIVD
ncbi:hypothetical protein A500_17300 [Clostridium sartagoforme AAU1]|uniref:Uncharacterized protein n=1 Tax=Clostridium sartagoforme AAU1 TaxID=1202534 RepID=R9BTM4_9CLOT|nr:hypothetical protein [Clostridium sartagoforme]EOR20413.1 hypothetical protein A500_17300 [Clostridium sartagoforme AAU1]